MLGVTRPSLGSSFQDVPLAQARPWRNPYESRPGLAERAAAFARHLTTPTGPPPTARFFANTLVAPRLPRRVYVDLDKTAAVAPMLFQVPWRQVTNDPTFLPDGLWRCLPLAPLAFEELILGGHPTHRQISEPVSRRLNGLNVVRVGEDFVDEADGERLFNFLPLAVMDDCLGRGGTVMVVSASLQDYAEPIGEIMRHFLPHATTPGAVFQVMGTPTIRNRQNKIQAVVFLQHGEGKLVRLLAQVLKDRQDNIPPEEIFFITDSHTDAPVFAALLDLGVPPENLIAFNPPNKAPLRYRDSLTYYGTWRMQLPYVRVGDGYEAEKKYANAFEVTFDQDRSLLLVHRNVTFGERRDSLRHRERIVTLGDCRALLLSPAPPVDYSAVYAEARARYGDDERSALDWILRIGLPEARMTRDSGRHAEPVELVHRGPSGYISLGRDLEALRGRTLQLWSVRAWNDYKTFEEESKKIDSNPDNHRKRLSDKRLAMLRDGKAEILLDRTFSPRLPVVTERKGQVAADVGGDHGLIVGDGETWEEVALRDLKRQRTYSIPRRVGPAKIGRRRITPLQRWWAMARPIAEWAMFSGPGTVIRIAAEGEAATSSEAVQMAVSHMAIGAVMAVGTRVTEMALNVAHRDNRNYPNNSFALRWIARPAWLAAGILAYQSATAGVWAADVPLAAVGAATAGAAAWLSVVIGGWLVGGTIQGRLKQHTNLPLPRMSQIKGLFDTVGQSLGPAAISLAGRFFEN